jgi:hypothetical protein
MVVWQVARHESLDIGLDWHWPPRRLLEGLVMRRVSMRHEHSGLTGFWNRRRGVLCILLGGWIGFGWWSLELSCR